MNSKEIMKIFEETAYVRMGGSPEELRCAEYIAECCTDLGLQATIEPFAVPMSTMQEASLEVDGKQIPCKGDLQIGLFQLGFFES